MKDLLGGLRIVDVTTIVMGPMASQMLADLGADVIKVEAPEGDLARHSGTPGPDGMGALFANNNRNKRSLAVDLGQEAGRAVLARLVERADGARARAQQAPRCRCPSCATSPFPAR